MLEDAIAQWRATQGDLWVFGYASLIWRPEFEFTEQRAARVMGYHRALKMWSSINRGTPECPGLVFALLAGGSCKGVVFRIPALVAEVALRQLWPREMPNAVYDPKWLRCQTGAGVISALAFTLSKRSPSFTDDLSPAQYRQIFGEASGRYGTTWDYAQQTLAQLEALGIHDAALTRLLRLG
jgi:glutathione-specific gamma-glutamylcyclotransferase